MKKIFLATKNQHKVLEFKQMCPEFYWQLPPPHFQFLPETGSSFAENAQLKAQSLQFYLDLHKIHYDFILADDSGLCVQALDGAPGVYSARYAGDKATDAENNQKLVVELENVKDLTAQFEAVLCVIDVSFNQKLFFGCCEGQIILQAKGEQGFGYDAHFLVPKFGKTFAELSLSEKASVSHRGNAIKKLKDYLETL